MDRTVMEKPNRAPRNFSIVVPYNVYSNLHRISVPDRLSLGAVCRQMLEIITPPLYEKLRQKAYKEQVTITALCRRILEKAVK